MSQTPPLNPWRDDYVARVRALVERFDRTHPGDLDGILGRGSALVQGQLPALEALGALNLDAATTDPAEAKAAVATLYRAQHLPTMLVAMSRVLEQEERDRALRPIAVEAQTLVGELAALTQAWVVLHYEDLGDPDGDDDLWV